MKAQKRLLKISTDIGLPRYSVNGMMTDVLAIKTNKACHNAVNMTCGYHNSFGSNKNEFIDIQEAKDTMKYVASIVKDYYLSDSPTHQYDKVEEEDLPFSIEFTEEEMSAMEQMHASSDVVSTGSARKTRHYYDDDGDDLFSEKLYDNDRGGSDSEWDSWRNSPTFES